MSPILVFYRLPHVVSLSLSTFSYRTIISSSFVTDVFVINKWGKVRILYSFVVDSVTL